MEKSDVQVFGIMSCDFPLGLVPRVLSVTKYCGACMGTSGPKIYVPQKKLDLRAARQSRPPHPSLPAHVWAVKKYIIIMWIKIDVESLSGNSINFNINFINFNNIL